MVVHSKLIKDVKKLLATLSCTVEYIGKNRLKVQNNKGTFLLYTEPSISDLLRFSMLKQGYKLEYVNNVVKHQFALEPQYVSFFKIPFKSTLIKVPANTPFKVIKKLLQYNYIDVKIIEKSDNQQLKYNCI